MKTFLLIVAAIFGTLVVSGAFSTDEDTTVQREPTAVVTPTVNPDPAPTWVDCSQEEDYIDRRDCEDLRGRADYEWEQRQPWSGPSAGHDETFRCYPISGCE
jgi:hypothetical protein